MGPAFEFIHGGGETLGAVVIGAVLATAGGVVASHVEAGNRRRERERTAALLFGEILAAMQIVAPQAVAARSRGEPYGPFTLRLLRALRREAETFDRFRESLYDIGDADLRLRLYTMMVRLSLSLDGIFEVTERLSAAGVTPAEREENERARDAAFEFVIETAGEAAALVDRLAPIARHTFAAQRALIEEFRPRPG